MPLGPQKDLFKKYNLNPEHYAAVKKHWPRLRVIYNDYLNIRPRLNMHVPLIVGPLTEMVSQVHSIRYRLKDPEHLIEKVIRKELWERITVENYKQEVTDLVGVRVLHLFKADWMHIHRYIIDNWTRKKAPVANVREGDSKELTKIYKRAGCRVNKHNAGYRSVHYLVKTPAKNEQQMIEIQVRTIFEEGWSEIDHTFRYPYDPNNEMIRSFIDILNRQAGSADEIGTYLKDLHADWKLEPKSDAKKLRKGRTTVENRKMETARLKADTKELPRLDLRGQNEPLVLSHERMLERQIEIIKRTLHTKAKRR